MIERPTASEESEQSAVHKFSALESTVKIDIRTAAHSVGLFLSRTLLLGICGSVFLLGTATQCAWSAERDLGWTNTAGATATNDQSASPQKLYEAISAYEQGMHGKRDSKQTKTARPSKKRHAPTVVALGEEPALRLAMTAEEDLAVKRLERHESDSAVLALERALKSKSSAGGWPHRAGRS